MKIALSQYLKSRSTKEERKTKEQLIYIRIQSGDDRVYINTNKYCKAKDFTAFGVSDEQLNAFLAGKLKAIKKIADSGDLTPEQVKNRYLDSITESKNEPLQVLIEKFLSRPNKRPNTVRNHKQVLTQFAEYLKGENPTDLSGSKFLSTLSHKANTLNKYGKILKTFLKFSRIPTTLEIPKAEPVEKDYLTPEELRVIEKLSLKGLQERVRDYFLLMAWTGLRVSDMDKLHPEHFKRDRYGDFIDLKQTKTGKRVTPLLTRKAKALFKKYDFKKPPRVNNVAANEEIKTIIGLAGINKFVTCHTARKSRAMYLIDKGHPPQVVATQLGDSVKVLLQSYYSDDHTKGRKAVSAL